MPRAACLVEIKAHVAPEHGQVGSRGFGGNLVEHVGGEAAVVGGVVDEVQQNLGTRQRPIAAADEGEGHRFVERGLAFNSVDQAIFRARLSGVYREWKEKLGGKCWGLLEAEVGRLG